MKLYLCFSLVLGLVLLAFSAKTNAPETNAVAPPPVVPAVAASVERDVIAGPPETESATVTGNERLLGIQRDISGSGDETEVKAMAPALRSGIRARAESVDGVAVIRVGNGNRSTLAEPVEVFRWGRLEIKPFVEPSLENAPIDVRLFADRKRRYIAQAQANYDAEKERLTREFYGRVDRELDRLTAYLIQPPAESAPCTRFSSIASRIERDNYPFDLLITDGWRDCPEERNRRLSPARPNGKLVVIQLTRVGDSVANESELRAREAFLRQLFPTAQVMPAYMAVDAVETLFR